jgi:hypothetical protein
MFCSCRTATVFGVCLTACAIRKQLAWQCACKAWKCAEVWFKGAPKSKVLQNVRDLICCVLWDPLCACWGGGALPSSL